MPSLSAKCSHPLSPPTNAADLLVSWKYPLRGAELSVGGGDYGTKKASFWA
jgi:hypothetical protein